MQTENKIITLNIDDLNSPIKRQRLGEWIKKLNPSFHCLQETHFTLKDRHHLQVKGWKNFSSKWHQKAIRRCSFNIRQDIFQSKTNQRG